MKNARTTPQYTHTLRKKRKKGKHIKVDENLCKKKKREKRNMKEKKEE